MSEKEQALPMEEQETPVAEAAVSLVHGIENGLYEITRQNVDFLL